jgi:hypothetical protein
VVIVKPSAVQEGEQLPRSVADASDTATGVVGEVVQGVDGVVGELLAL